MAIPARCSKAAAIEVFALKTAWVPMLWTPSLGEPEVVNPSFAKATGVRRKFRQTQVLRC